MTEADFSKKLGPAGAYILAAFIGRKYFQDNGAMSKLDISSNDIGGYARDGDGRAPWVHSPEGSNALAGIIKSSRSLKELKISNIHLQPKGAKILAPAIQDNGALASLDISNNKLIEESSDIKQANQHKKGDLIEYQGAQCPVTYACGTYFRVTMLHGIFALANAIQDMGALASLNLANNKLGVEGAQHLAKVLPTW